MKISIRKGKRPKTRKTRKTSKAKKKFKLPKLKMPKIKMPKMKIPKMKIPSFKKMGEEHFVVMILAVVAVIAVVGLFMYGPVAEMNITGAATGNYPAVCNYRCAPNEQPAGFVYLGSGNIQCLCKAG